MSSWTPLSMYQVGKILYGYILQSTRERTTERIAYFKIIAINGNKLTLVRLLSKTVNMGCKVPANQKDDKTYNVTFNKFDGTTKIRYEGKTFPLKRWDGEPKWSD